MNQLFKLSLFLFFACLILSCHSKQKPIAYRSFTQEEGAILLASAVKIEPIGEPVLHKEWIKMSDDSKDSVMMTISTRSFNVYVATNDKGVLIRNPTKQDSVSAIITGEPPPIVVSPYCVGHCPPGCEKTGCIAEGGGCSDINCTGECNVGNMICSNYGTFFGATSIQMQ